MRTVQNELALKLLVFIAILSLSACSGSRSTMNNDLALPSEFPNHTLDQIRTNLAILPLPLDAYKAETAFSIRTPSQSGSFSASISHKKNDSLLISISPGLGIVAVRTLVTPDSFFVHDRINKELTLGRLESLQRIFPLPSSSEAIYASMLGLLTPEENEDWELEVGNRYYTVSQPTLNTSFIIDPIYWRVVRYEERSASGSLLEERTYSEFDDIDGVFLPRRLTFRRPEDDTAASIYYRDLTINPSSLSFDFNVSSSVQRIILP